MCLLQQALLAPLHRNGKLYGPAFSQQANVVLAAGSASAAAWLRKL